MNRTDVGWRVRGDLLAPLLAMQLLGGARGAFIDGEA